MFIHRKHRIFLLVALLLLPLFACLHLFSGQIEISWQQFIQSLVDFQSEEQNLIIAREIRIPRMATAFLAGGALSVAGLLMQTLFRNPLAGPYILGINSGSGLFVALTIMTGVPFFLSDFGMILNALLGAFLFGLVILFFARLVRNQVSLLLIGIMLGSFVSAFIAIIQTLSESNELKIYTLWNLGSLQKTQFAQLPYFALLVFGGVAVSLLISKRLNLLVLGDQEARLLGLNIRVMRYFVIAITAVLAGIVTAFCGPIAFVGLAVPNIVRIVFKTQQHFVLILACFVVGAIFLLLVDSIIQVLEAKILIPINALTSIIGAPLVVYIIFKKLK